MTAPPPAKVAPFLTDSYVFDWKAQSFRADFIFILPLALCLGLGIGLGHPGAALIVAGGAFTIGFGAKQHIDESRFLPMILGSLGIGLATFIGMVAGHTNFLLVFIAAGAAFVYGMLSLRQAGISWVGQQSIVFLLVASAYPFSPRAAAIRSALVMAGGALQIISSSILLRLLQELRTDLLSVARYLREEHQALRSSVEQAARSLVKKKEVDNREVEKIAPPSATPYAVRLAITVGVSTEIYRHFGFANGYWIPMTALLVLRPGLSDTASRAIARTLGTLLGAILASFALAHLTPSSLTLAVLILFFAWLAYSLNSVNYGLFVLCLTAYIVCLLALASIPGNVVAYHRAISTVIGGFLALSVRLLVIRYRKQHATALPETQPSESTAN
jgi:Fusaric acid resistance protein-like